MKFGFAHLITEDYRRHVALVRVAEDLGFDFAWLPDQTFYPDPYVLLGMAALETSKIQLGIGVTNPYTRHPAMSARAVATVDQLSNGRAHLGVGAGNRKELLNPLGYDGSHAGPMSREMVEVVRGLLSNQPFEYHGRHFQIKNMSFDFETRPDLQLWIAGRGRTVLQAAGAVADGVIIGALCTAPGLEFALGHVREGARLAGREARRHEVLSWVTCHLTEDRAATLKQLRPTIGHIIGGAPLQVMEAVGLPKDLVLRIKQAYAEGIAQAAEYVTDECIDALAIVGDGDAVIRRIRLLQQMGITQVSILLPRGTVSQHEERLREFSRQVMPAFA